MPEIPFWKKFMYVSVGFAISLIVLWTAGLPTRGCVASETARNMVANALLAREGEICAHKFKTDPNFEKNLVILRLVHSWARDYYFKQEGDWTFKEGEFFVRDEVAPACVEMLMPFLE